MLNLLYGCRWWHLPIQKRIVLAHGDIYEAIEATCDFVNAAGVMVSVCQSLQRPIIRLWVTPRIRDKYNIWAAICPHTNKEP